MRYLFLLIFVARNLILICQSNVTLEWSRTYDGIVGGSDYPCAIAVDDSDNVYVTGRSSGLNYLDMITLKYDREGKLVWEARYDGGSDDSGYGIAVDDLGNVFVTGYSYVTPGHSGDYCTIKYSCTGVQQWIKTYDSPNCASDVAWNIILDDSGNCYVSGWIESGMYNYDFCTIKYDVYGNTLWLSTYDGPAHSGDIAVSFTKDRFGDLFVSGESVGIGTYYDYCIVKYDHETGDSIWVARYSGAANDMDSPSGIVTDIYGNCYVTGWSMKDTTLDILTIKYSRYGEKVWETRYDGTYRGEDRGYDIAIDSLCNVYVAGRSMVVSNNPNCILLKYNENGVQQWVQTYGGLANYYDAFYEVQVDRFDNIYTTGFILTSLLHYPYNYDFITAKYSPNGDLMWMEIYSDTANNPNQAYLLAVDKKCNVFVSGDFYISSTNRDFCTLKYSQLMGIANINNKQPGNFSLSQNYPNPFNPTTNIKFSIPLSRGVSEGWGVLVRLIIYNILGREIAVLVNERLSPGTFEIEWDASNYPSGVYFYKLLTSEFIETKKMVLIK